MNMVVSSDFANLNGDIINGDICPSGIETKDIQWGTSCHQCRQKTLKRSAACKNMKNKRQCSMRMCNKCLLNRYGEKVEEVSLLSDWKCPKCRGICNCSLCMKKKGHAPTGQLYLVAKENGFLSVSEMLQKAPPAQENCTENKEDVLLTCSIRNESTVQKSQLRKARKPMREELVEISNSIGSDIGKNENIRKKSRMCIVNHGARKQKEENANFEFISEKKGGIEKLSSAGIGFSANKNSPACNNDRQVHGKGNRGGTKVIKGSKGTKAHEAATELTKMFNGKEAKMKSNMSSAVDSERLMTGTKRRKPAKNSNESLNGSSRLFACTQPQASLPSGKKVNVVAGTMVSPEDVGEALQFLEFCDAFGKALNIRKGQPEAMLTEIIDGRQPTRLRSSWSTSLVDQFYIRLLNMIKNRSPDKSNLKELGLSWFQLLGEIVSESQLIENEFSNVDFKRLESYEEIKPSKKFKLLNFLCDEALNSECLRSLIDKEVSIHREKQSKIDIKAKNKLMRDMRDDLIKQMRQRNDAPLDAMEYDALLRKAVNDASKIAYVQAARTNPVLNISDGRVLWKFNCDHGLSDNLLQDVNLMNAEVKEQWTSYTAEQNVEVDKFIGQCLLPGMKL